MIAELEAELQKPIVACNAALYWQTLRALGVSGPAFRLRSAARGTLGAMARHVRVAVIGGGIAGVSCLYHLAKMGCSDALLLERDELTSGSTWHAAGHVPTYAASWSGMRAQNYAWRLYKDLAAEVDAPIAYHVTGAYWPAHTADRMAHFAYLAGIAKSLALDLRLVTVAEMQARHPLPGRPRASRRHLGPL